MTNNVTFQLKDGVEQVVVTEEDVQRMLEALRTCRLLAQRALRKRSTPFTPERMAEEWGHVLNATTKAGLQDRILRGSVNPSPSYAKPDDKAGDTREADYIRALQSRTRAQDAAVAHGKRMVENSALSKAQQRVESKPLRSWKCALDNHRGCRDDRANGYATICGCTCHNE
jgi:hypothetical protein